MTCVCVVWEHCENRGSTREFLMSFDYCSQELRLCTTVIRHSRSQVWWRVIWVRTMASRTEWMYDYSATIARQGSWRVHRELYGLLAPLPPTPLLGYSIYKRRTVQGVRSMNEYEWSRLSLSGTSKPNVRDTCADYLVPAAEKNEA